MAGPGPGDQDEQYDFLFKLVLVGDASVGKTCVVQRFKTGAFSERQGSTIGVDFTMKTLEIQGKRVKVGGRRGPHASPRRADAAPASGFLRLLPSPSLLPSRPGFGVWAGFKFESAALVPGVVTARAGREEREARLPELAPAGLGSEWPRPGTAALGPRLTDGGQPCPHPRPRPSGGERPETPPPWLARTRKWCFWHPRAKVFVRISGLATPPCPAGGRGGEVSPPGPAALPQLGLGGNRKLGGYRKGRGDQALAGAPRNSRMWLPRRPGSGLQIMFVMNEIRFFTMASVLRPGQGRALFLLTQAPSNLLNRTFEKPFQVSVSLDRVLAHARQVLYPWLYVQSFPQL
jgi:hypothetical protein